MFGDGKDNATGNTGGGNSGNTTRDTGGNTGNTTGNTRNTGGNTPPAPTSQPNTLTITVPTATGYASGEIINVAFKVSGPGFKKRYDYDIISL